MQIGHDLQVRRGVAALHVCLHGKIPCVGFQWPAKAAACGELNLSSIQGGTEPCDGSLACAMKREFGEEYGIDNVEILSRLFSEVHISARGEAKELTFFLVRTGWKMEPNPQEVAQFAWCVGPKPLPYVLSAMSPGKRRLMVRAIKEAAQLEPKLKLFSPLVR